MIYFLFCHLNIKVNIVPNAKNGAKGIGLFRVIFLAKIKVPPTIKESTSDKTMELNKLYIPT